MFDFTFPINFWTILTAAIVSPVVTGAIAFLLRTHLTAFFTGKMQKEVNRHKQELDSQTERLKSGLQREAMQSECLINGKHTIYPELYKKLLIAEGALLVNEGLRFTLDDSVLTDDDIKGILEQNNVLASQIDEILSTLKRDRNAGIEKYRKMIMQCEVSEARRALTDAKNYFFVNELYLTEHVSNAVSKVLSPTDKISAELHTRIAAKGHWRDLGTDKVQLRDSIEQLRTVMSNELTPMNPGM